MTVDFDPQGNTTSGLGLEKGNIDNTVYELLMGECSVEECIRPSVQERLDVMASDVDLAGAEIELLDLKDKEGILKKNLALVSNEYDFIIIDCPPSLNLLTINALTAANTVLVPIQCEYYALEGLSQVLKTVGLVQKKLNPELEIEGVVFTMYDSRTNLSLEVVENVKAHLNENIYKTEKSKYNCDIVVANKMNEEATQEVDVAGNVCESGDLFARDRPLPDIEEGDILGILNAGAYGYTMASNYNKNTIPGVVFVKDGVDRVVVKPQTYDDMLANEIL